MPSFDCLEEQYKKAILPYSTDSVIPRDTAVFIVEDSTRRVMYVYVGVSPEGEFDYEIYQAIGEDGVPEDLFIDMAKDPGTNEYDICSIAEQTEASLLFDYGQP